MKKLCVQLQPDLAPELDFPTVVSRLSAIGNNASQVRVSEGHDNGCYTNIVFNSADTGNLWPQVREVLRENVSLLRCSIVTCQGDADWDDYLMLHHFDANQQLDEPP